MSGKKNAHQLFTDSFCADGVDRVGRPSDCIPGRRFDFKLQHGGETDGAQEPKPVFCKTLRRIADRPHESRGKVGPSANEVDHGVVRRVEKHPIDREIAPTRIFFGRRKIHRYGMATVEVSAIRAKGRDLKLPVAFQHDNDTKMRPDGVGAGEKFLHLFRARVGCDIDVLGRLASNQVAHTAAGEIGDVPGRAQSIDERARGRFHRGYLHGEKLNHRETDFAEI